MLSLFKIIRGDLDGDWIGLCGVMVRIPIILILRTAFPDPPRSVKNTRCFPMLRDAMPFLRDQPAHNAKSVKDFDLSVDDGGGDNNVDRQRAGSSPKCSCMLKSI